MMTKDSHPGRETEVAQSNSADNLELTSSLSGVADTPSPDADLRMYFEATYGESVGQAHMSVGTEPQLTAKKKYDFTDFKSFSFAWPQEADAMVDTIIKENAKGETDVYVCPNLMQGSTRKKGAAVARWTVHADVDDDVDLDRVRRVKGWAVASGSKGHAQVYVTLTESIPAQWHEALCLGLKDLMGATDSKISDNDLLRPPGSVNHKGPVFGTGPATTAKFLIWPGEAQDPQTLAAALGITLPSPPTPASKKRITGVAKRIMATASLNLDELPQSIRDAVAELSDDRSKDTMRIVGACHDAGLALEKTRAVVGSRTDLTERLDDRDDDDVQSCWLKAVDSRQERRQRNGPASAIAASKGTSAKVRGGIQPAPASTPEEDQNSIRLKFPRLDLAALVSADRPPRPWVVRDLIPAGTSVSVVSEAGTGKSLLVLAMCMAVARGDAEFAGYQIPQQRRTILIDMENTEDDLADRVTSLGVTATGVAELDDLVLIHLPPLAALDTRQGGRELAALVEAYEVGAGDVVILDSLQRVTTGAESDSDTMRGFYAHTGIMLKRLGITVIRTDNTGKDLAKRARGTSGKRDDVDLELILTRKGDLMTLTPTKERLRGMQVAHFTRVVDDTMGSLQFLGAGDAHVDWLADAVAKLDELGLPPHIGESKASEALKKADCQMVRSVLRAALRERKSAST
jgi:archaellum biogenesis ATPase FlaH